MARTRQKAKQRKAKRLEQERKAAERSGQRTGDGAATEAVRELEEAQLEVAEEVQEARRAAEVATAPEPTPVPPRESVQEKASWRERRRAEVAQRKKPQPEKARPEKRAEKRPEKARPPARAERRRDVRSRGRIINFFIQVWAELRRVQWPDRTQVTQATGVVIVFCVIAGAYLASWDYLFSKLIGVLL
jgi:preprotein translocase subunit SecE